MISRLINMIRRRCRIKNRQRDFDALTSHSIAAVRNVYQAIEQSKTNSFSGTENEAMNLIELLRDRLIAADEPVSSVDYGAGDPKDSRPQDISENGVKYTTSTAEICRQGNVAMRDRHLLFSLVRLTRPSLVLEMGTSLGFSAAYMAAALRLNESGALITLDGAPELIEKARSHLHELELEHVCKLVTGRFSDTLPGILSVAHAIDLAFIDGHHDGNATLGYFRQLLPHLSHHAVVVFDDIHWYESMEKAWSQLKTSPDFIATFELDAVGIGVVNKNKDCPATAFRL